MTQHLTIRHFKPINVPASLTSLQGPAAGTVSLPHHIVWAPGTNEYDLGDLGAATVVYQAVLTEGTTAEICKYLNADRLIQLWPRLSLDRFIIDAWASRFPELKGRGWAPPHVTISNETLHASH